MKAQSKEHSARQRLDVVAVARLVARAQLAILLKQTLMIAFIANLKLKLELGESVSHGGYVRHGGHDLIYDA